MRNRPGSGSFANPPAHSTGTGEWSFSFSTVKGPGVTTLKSMRQAGA
jgi:hypothetical protein